MCRLVVGLFLLSLPVVSHAQPPEVPPPVAVPGAPGGFPDATDLARQYKELIPALIESLKDLDADVRQHSAIALASLGPAVIKPLTVALTDPIKDKRAAAAYALGQMGYEGRDAMPALLKALKDDESIVRRFASQAISRIVSGDLAVVGASMKPLPGLMPSGGFGGPGRPTIPPINVIPLLTKPGPTEKPQ